MSKRSLGWGGVVSVGILCAFGCGQGDALAPTVPPEVPVKPNPRGNPAPDGGTRDAGQISDAGAVDSGTASDAGSDLDAGSGIPDSGVTDAGTGGGQLDAGTIILPTAQGWQFFGPQQGGPSEVYGVTSDASGNIWVAGGMDGLFLLTPGAAMFQKFTVADGLYGWDDGTGAHQQNVISVAGGPANTVFVGYEGLPGCQDAFEVYNWSTGVFVFDAAHEYIWKSGDADRVVYNGSGITASHYDISSRAGIVKAEPQGREKLCTIYRLVYHAGTNSVWFGGNHGVALGDSNTMQVQEHFHPSINGWLVNNPGPGDRLTLLTDLYYGMSLTSDGGLWLGGAARSAFCSGPSAFWTCESNFSRGDTDLYRLDIWPDAVPEDPTPSQRKDDNVSDMAALPDGTVWVASFDWGLAHVKGTTEYPPIDYLNITDPNSAGHATSLELDPTDGSLWIGFQWGGLARWNVGGSGNTAVYDYNVFGQPMVSNPIPDIQSDSFAGQRRILVAFHGSTGNPGVIGIYTGN